MITAEFRKAIPPEILSVRRWVCWGFEFREGRKTKVPYSPWLGEGDTHLIRASSTNSKSWDTLDTALAFAEAHKSIDGVGIVLGDGLAGVDLDHCHGEHATNGTTDDWAVAIVNEINTYTDVSPSGTGLKLLLHGVKPPQGCRKHIPDAHPDAGIELYDNGRFFTLTGNHFPGTPCSVQWRQDQLTALHTRLFPVVNNDRRVINDTAPLRLEDEKIIELALAATNGEKFKLLFRRGDTSLYKDNESSADQALVNLLVFYTHDRDQLDRLMRKSALARPKWTDRPDYRDRTIDKALVAVKESYKPPKDADLRRQEEAAEEIIKPYEGLETPHINGRMTDDTAEFVKKAVAATVKMAEQKAANAYHFNPMSSADFAKRKYAVEWLVKKLLVKGQPCILGGPKKALKTTIAADLAISLGSGSPFLEAFDVPKPVRSAFISGESGEATLQETFFRICKSKGIRPEDAGVWWDTRLPQLAQNDELADLARGLAERGIEVVIIDPMYLCLLSGEDAQGKQASNLFDMGPLLLKVARACLSAGATPILATHARKNLISPNDPIELEDLAFSGIQEFARQWMLVNRRNPFNPGSGLHQLWMTAGGSCGHGGTWGLNINEGKLDENFGGRVWEVVVESQGVVIQAHKEEKEARLAEKKTAGGKKECEEFLATLDNFVLANNGTQPSKSNLATLLGWYKPKFDRNFLALTVAGKIEAYKDEYISGNGTKQKADFVRRVQWNGQYAEERP